MKRDAWDEVGTKRNPPPEKPWIGYTNEGKPYQKPRCWADPDGCQRFIDARDFDFEHHLCKECVRAIETNWQATPGMVATVLACIRLDRQATHRVRSINKDPEFLATWNQTRNERIDWLLKKLGPKAERLTFEEQKKLSISFFKGAITRAGGTAGQGSGMGVE